MTGVAYDKLWVVYPPRPSGSISPKGLNGFPGWWGQYKFNGTNTLVVVHPDGEIEFYTRHRELHKAYKLTDEMRKSVASLALPSGKFHLLNGELMHSKTRAIKDRLVLFDVLVYNGRYLTGTTYRDRYWLLHDLCRGPKNYETETGRELALRVHTNLWLVESFDADFPERFGENIDLDEIEGLVLKDPNGLLEFGTREDNNSRWLVRCRKPHENYQF